MLRGGGAGRRTGSPGRGGGGTGRDSTDGRSGSAVAEAAGAAQAGFDEEAIFHLELCCDEASTNIIEHAYGGEDGGDITISYKIGEDDFTIVICDQGATFDPGLVPSPPTIDADEDSLDEVINQLRIGGLGLHFIRNLMDEVHFSSDRQKGNELVMVKKLDSNPGKETS